MVFQKKRIILLIKLKLQKKMKFLILPTELLFHIILKKHFKKLFVYGTAEYQNIDKHFINGNSEKILVSLRHQIGLKKVSLKQV